MTPCATVADERSTPTEPEPETDQTDAASPPPAVVPPRRLVNPLFGFAAVVIVVAGLQAFVFVFLTSTFLGMAMHPEH